jgi:ribonuclease P protein component
MFTFKKAERLSSKKDIEALFKKPGSFLVYPIKFSYRVSPFEETGFPARLLVSVPKRNFKKAVDRNLLKRRIRESYRQLKPSFYEDLNSLQLKIDLQISFIGKEILEFAKIEQAIKNGLQKIPLQLKKTPKPE